MLLSRKAVRSYEQFVDIPLPLLSADDPLCNVKVRKYHSFSSESHSCSELSINHQFQLQPFYVHFVCSLCGFLSGNSSFLSQTKNTRLFGVCVDGLRAV